MIDPESRCGRCGRIMRCMDDHAFEGFVEGYYYECQGVACKQAQRDAENAYWANFDHKAFADSLSASNDVSGN